MFQTAYSFQDDYFISVECQMFVVEGISKLIANAAGGANGLINVTMGMAVYPIVDATGCNIVCKFDGKGSVNTTSLKLW